MSRSEKGDAVRRPRPRLESLSDLIYGLSLSIGAIGLVVNGVQSSGIGDINRNVIDFVFVFLILVTGRIVCTETASVLPIGTRPVTSLNVVLLVLVAVMPYPFEQAILNSNTVDVQNYASSSFDTDLSGQILIASAFAHVIASEGRRPAVEAGVLAGFRRSRNLLFFVALFVPIGLGVPWDWILFQAHVRMLVCFVPVVVFWANRMRRRPFGVGGIGPGQTQDS
ncbi:MAG: hypothetical protein ABSF83_08460 [Nitrososphaerales archaeon]